MTIMARVNKMGWPPRRILVGLAVLLTASTLLFTTSTYVARAHGLSPHDPIYISGDASFTSVNGVVNGSGVPQDPYVIAGWDINATGGPLPVSAIHVRNTHASFIIRDVLIHTSQSPLETRVFI